jgi:hypothetical protein
LRLRVDYSADSVVKPPQFRQLGNQLAVIFP